MKILMLTHSCDRPQIALFNALVEMGHSVSLSCKMSMDRFPLPISQKVRIYNMFPQHRFDITAMFKIRKLVKENKFDIVHAWDNKSLSVIVAGRVYQFSKVFGYRGTIGHLRVWNPSSYFTYLHPGLSGIICNCNAVKEYLVSKGVNPDRVFTVYKGHKVEWYKNSMVNNTGNEIRFTSKKKTICFVGNVRPVKGVDVLLRALSFLPRNIHLFIVGEIRENSIRHMVKRLGLEENVHFTGFVANPFSYISESDIFVMPSIGREGMPRALVEAMSIGKPVIATAVGGIPELVRHNIDGILVPAGDHTLLADAIKNLLESPSLCYRLGQAALKRVDTFLSVENMVNSIISIYKRDTTS